MFSFLDRRPRVAMLRLAGTIAARPGVGTGLSLAALSPAIERAFALPRLAAVFLVINSPGGSAVQSSLIAGRIRALADRRSVPVVACVEDAAASGGYWLACAADEIVVDPASIVGSIGVIAASFGFEQAIGRLGVERRLHTAGTEKSFLDPFRAERPADLERLRDLLEATHEEFRAWVRTRRGAKLKLTDTEAFSGRFWTGRQAVELGLADRLGEAENEARRRYGKRARLVTLGAPRVPLLRRLLPGLSGDGLLAAVEERAAWARLGL